MLTVSEYRDLASIDGIRNLWRELWWKTPRASFFQSVEWFENHCKRTADVQQPRVFVVYLAGRPLGLVPWVERCVRGSVGRLRVLSDAAADQGVSRGPLGARPDLTMETVLNYMRTDQRWDRLELGHVELGQAERARFEPGDVEKTTEMRRFDPPQSGSKIEESRAVVECRGDWVRFLRSLPAHVRESYQRSERLLAERGKVDYVRYRPEGTPLNDDDPRWELVGELERTAGDDDAACDAHGFHRELHEAATSIAAVDLNLLRLNDKPIAWAYNYRCDGRIEIQRLWATGGPAAEAACVLVGRMLCDGFRRGDESYLFNRATSRTAGGWQTGRVTSYRRLHYPGHGARFVRLLSGFSR